MLILGWFLSDAEQYDTFVKFTHDQLMRRFEEQPASCKWLARVMSKAHAHFLTNLCCYYLILICFLFSLSIKDVSWDHQHNANMPCAAVFWAECLLIPPQTWFEILLQCHSCWQKAVFRICQYILLFLVNLGASSCKCIRTFNVCLFYQWPTYNLSHEPFLAFHSVSIQIPQCFIFWSFYMCIDVSMDGNPRCWIPLCECCTGYSWSFLLKKCLIEIFTSQTKCSQRT